MNLSTEARQFLHRSRKGVLSTHSARFAGYPFGSIAPFVVDHSGCPVILISTLAEHTKNILQNPHVSLIVLDDADDMQANARLTVLGQCADQNDGAAGMVHHKRCDGAKGVTRKACRVRG